ncbi:hypothetical protein AVEN_151463-1 [Araneus ventricosus]|uniref:Integrase catalytic domain-containing protein n=1 Tax=Araneus ventricosus TaxID=182803 RepID=A0A4Y2JGT1_ARAVE|nr:hypothetical protein AVEN_151463-1 [Araneus ventricosus]
MVHSDFRYYSRNPEIARIDRPTSAEVIYHCKSIFYRHGIPDVVSSDNGSQFDTVKTVEFKDFAKSYGFKHITSSPKFSQSNGLIEAAVKTVKARIKKSRDPYLTLMAYRAIPLALRNCLWVGESTLPFLLLRPNYSHTQ